MLTSMQSLELTLPDLFIDFKALNLPFENSFKIEDFEVNNSVGLISFTGEKVLINTSEFFKLDKKEQLYSLVFINLCKQNYSEFNEISSLSNIDSLTLNISTHFYVMKQLNDLGISFKPSSINLFQLKENITVSDTLTDTYHKFLNLGLENVVLNMSDLEKNHAI